jgi:hypothetical protein
MRRDPENCEGSGGAFDRKGRLQREERPSLFLRRFHIPQVYAAASQYWNMARLGLRATASRNRASASVRRPSVQYATPSHPIAEVEKYGSSCI